MKFLKHPSGVFQKRWLIKSLIIMKLTFIIVLISCMQVSARSYSQKLTLNLKSVNLKKALAAIEKHSDFRFLYSERKIANDDQVNINVTDASISQVMDQLLTGTGLTYKELGNNLIVLVQKNEVVLDVIVKGKVTDKATGQPLSGVSIQIKGSNSGTTTDADGNYSINVPGKATLIVSSVDHKEVEIAVNGQTVINISLEASTTGLNEVVVVGYGTQKKENVTGAIGVIQSSSLSDRPTSSPANLLQGLSPGVTVMTQGSYPGASANIKIRETSTWQGGTDPLYVIDGFVRDATTFASINPADIDNISILKDAASAAIYGIRGGNGVILVTTKHGVAGKTSISYNASYTWNTREIIPRIMDAFDAATFSNNALLQKVPATDPSIYTSDELDYFKTHSYNWVDATWRNPWNTSHNLSLSGGSKVARFYISGAYFHQEGATSNSFDKYNFMAKLNGQITNRISYDLIINGEWGNGTRPFWAYDGGDFNLSNMYNRLLMTTPWRPPFINGLPVGNLDNTNTANLAEGNGGYTRPTNNIISPTFQLKYDIPGVKGLSAKGTIAYSTTNNYTKAWRNSPYIYYFKTAGEHNHIITDELDSSRSGGYKIIDQAQTAGVGAPTELNESYSQSSNYQLDLMLNYEHSFGKHNISAFGGYEQSASKGHFSNIWDDNYSNPNYQQINGGSPNSTDWFIQGDINQPTGYASYLGRIDYNYASKYMLGITFREDGSYVFPPDKRWGSFPAVSAGWNIAKENFFSDYTKYLDFLKLRVSYGITGTDNTAPWQWQQTYNFNASSGQYLGSSLPPSTSLGSTVNPDITWERNHNYDIGLDFAMPSRLISGTVDYWYKKTTDILGTRNASVPSTVGASLPAVNYGIAAAKGLELSLSHENHIGAFFYRVGANWAVSSNKYLKVDQAASVRDYQNLLGKPINGVIYGYVSKGIIRTQADIDNILQKNGANYTIFGSAPQLGMLNYQDIRGPLGTDSPDGKIDGNDQQPISLNGIPRINYGFNVTVGWKGINVSAIFSGLAKYDVMPTNVYYTRPLPGNANLDIWKNAWTPENAATATMPSAIMNDWQGTSNSEVNSTFWLMNGAFLRLKSLIVDYNIPARVLQNSRIKNIRVYFSGDNLFEWNHTKDWDPEMGGDFRTYPVLTGFTFGLNATF